MAADPPRPPNGDPFVTSGPRTRKPRIEVLQPGPTAAAAPPPEADPIDHPREPTGSRKADRPPELMRGQPSERTRAPAFEAERTNQRTTANSNLFTPRNLLIALLALGLLALLRALRGHPLLPQAVGDVVRRRTGRTNPADQKVHALAAVVFVAALLVSRNFVLAVIAGAAVVLWPLVAGGGKAERAELAKLEALAQWTESLRDLAQKGAGLESVIPKTVDTASDVLLPQLRLMSRRLSVKVPLPEALSRFADEVDESSADMVVAALALAARQRKGKLSDVLSALSLSLRDELEQRTKVMRERNVVRREAAQVAVMTAVLVIAASLFSPQSLPEGKRSTAAQLLPLVLAVAYLYVFSRVRKLAEPEPTPRFLSSASDVLEAASYRPKGVNL